MSEPGAVAERDAGALIGIGQVRHSRLRPVRNRFAYRTWFVLLPMRRWRDRPADTALPRNRFGFVSFRDRDHGDGGDDCLAWVESLLAGEGVTDADGEIWLQTFPRVLGYAFKPVSFWYCHRRGGTLAAVVAEVNNTFGERHCYLLRGEHLANGCELRVAKVFHVSPFCKVEGDYRFRFLRRDPAPPAPGAGALARGPAARLIARIDHHDRFGALLETSISGRLEPLTGASIRRAFLAMPLLTLAVVARLHGQALRLWLRRVPVIGKPESPAVPSTDSTSP